MASNRGRVMFLDACAGISGDMFLGAAADVAAKLDGSFDLGGLLSAIALDGWELSVRREARGGITGLKVDVLTHESGGHEHTHEDDHTHEHDHHGEGGHSHENTHTHVHGHPSESGHHDHHHHGHPRRTLADIMEILSRSRISGAVREKAREAFTLLAEAEGEIHGVSPDEVHFHEVGAVDSIVDVTGAMLVMEHLGWPRVMSSPVNAGSGTVRCAHGILPVPAPAAAKLLEGMKIFSSGEPMERTTPTGALLLRVLAGADGIGSLPEGRVVCSGFGLGGRDTPDIPNALRATLLETDEPSRLIRESPSLLEANIDDMNPQDFALSMERLLEAGALDAWCENILMKKGRPAVKLCCLARRGDEERLAELMMRETTTIGVRAISTDRFSLARSSEKKSTPLGDVTYKSVTLDGEILRSAPEYEDVLRIAREKNMPIREVREAVSKFTARESGGRGK